MTGHGHRYLLVSIGLYTWTIAFFDFRNDIVIDICICIGLFSDDTSLFINVDDRVSLADQLIADLVTIFQRAETWF